MHLSSCLCCDPLHVTAVHVQTVRVLRRHRCIHVHRVDCMHIGCTTTNMDYTTRPGAVTASVHVIKKNGGEKKKSEARWMRIWSHRYVRSSAEETHRQWKAGWSLHVSSSWRQICPCFSLCRSHVRGVFTLIFSAVPLLFSKKKKIMCGCYTASILSSYHPLPTTKRRLTLRRPEAWSASYISLESGLYTQGKCIWHNSALHTFQSIKKNNNNK